MLVVQNCTYTPLLFAWPHRAGGALSPSFAISTINHLSFLFQRRKQHSHKAADAGGFLLLPELENYTGRDGNSQSQREQRFLFIMSVDALDCRSP